MTFPNPVLRTDLPVKRRRWPRVLAAGAILLVFGIAFLPQVLHTRIGRRILRAKLEGKYNAEITIGDFSTSWFGSTSVSQFWVKSADGRIIGFNTLKGDLSLGKLMRGKLQLGNCAVDGLIVDYVFDSGDESHYDTYTKLTGALPRKPGSPPAPLAVLSGKIQLTNAQINLYRGQTDAATLHAVFQSVKFSNVSGEMDIAALDQPWNFKLDGNVGISGEERSQTFSTSGMLCLGQGGVADPAAIKADATFKGAGVPTDLLPVIVPVISSEDCRDAFGSTFDKLEVKLKGDGGVLKLDVLADSAGGRSHIHLQPTFDLKTPITTITMTSVNPDDNLIAGGIPTGPLRIAMARVNPFALYAERGTAVLRIASLEAPLSTAWTIGGGKAELELHDVKLASPHESLDHTGPRALPAQLASITGDLNPFPALKPMPLPFTLDNGTITLSPSQLSIGDGEIAISGASLPDGKLQMMLSVSSPQLRAAVPEFAGQTSPALIVPLIGTAFQPTLDLDAMLRTLARDPAAKLYDWINRQKAALRSHEADAAELERQQKVEEIIRPFSPTKP